MNKNSYSSLKTNSEFWRRGQRVLKRRKKKAYFKKVIVFTLLFILAGVSYSGYVKFKNYLKGSDFLKIKSIKVHALNPEIKKEVERIIGNCESGSFLFPNIEKFKGLIMKNPFVKEVKIKRILPSTIEIFLTEREGVAIVEDGKYFIIDEEGEVVKEVEEAGSLPLIRGAHLKDKAAIGIATSFIRDMKNTGNYKYLEEIDLSNPFNIVAKIKNFNTRVCLGESDFIDKFERFLKIKDALEKEFGTIEYIGFYDRERVYVKIQSQN